MTDRVGQKIGNYRLVRLLGQGSFAEVHLGEHLFLGSYAAIKLLHVHVAQEDIAQFQQEGRMLATLEHPHIVRVLDFGIENSTPYLAMAYAPGGTLRTRHPKGNPVPLPTIVEYVRQVAQALQYAHDHKIIHRDIKPENMLISREGTILLSDFGIAVTSRSERTSLNSLADTSGTPYYMAPELFQGRPRTASDQYSLGIVVYAWLCGTPPFTEGNALQLGYQHLHEPVPPLRRQLLTLSPAVELVVMTALAKKPEDRFGSIRAFATALEQASLGTLDSRPLTPPSQPTRKPAPSTLSRRTILLGTVSMATVGIVGTVTWLLTPVDRGAPTSQVSPTPANTPTSQISPIPQGVLFVAYPRHNDIVQSVAWSPDGMRIVSCSDDSTAQVWNAHDGNQFFTYRGHNGHVVSVAWSPDNTRIASGSVDKTVQLWNAHDGSPFFTYHGHSNIVYSVAWSPDSTRIASGATDNTVQVWNARDGSQPFTYQGHSGYVWLVAWSPDGTNIASGSADKTVQVWNAHDGSQLFTYRGHSDTVTSVAWSPDGTRIVSASADKTVQVWNVRDGSQLFAYRGHSASVLSVAWSPDGRHIASGSADHSVQVWNAHDGSKSFIYRGHSASVLSVAWSPDGTRLASGSADNTVQVWQAV